jgi:hypothetical protein
MAWSWTTILEWVGRIFQPNGRILMMREPYYYLRTVLCPSTCGSLKKKEVKGVF